MDNLQSIHEQLKEIHSVQISNAKTLGRIEGTQEAQQREINALRMQLKDELTPLKDDVEDLKKGEWKRHGMTGMLNVVFACIIHPILKKVW